MPGGGKLGDEPGPDHSSKGAYTFSSGLWGASTILNNSIFFPTLQHRLNLEMGTLSLSCNYRTMLGGQFYYFSSPID